jgi:hypothetical protein
MIGVDGTFVVRMASYRYGLARSQNKHQASEVSLQHHNGHFKNQKSI